MVTEERVKELKAKADLIKMEASILTMKVGEVKDFTVDAAMAVSLKARIYRNNNDDIKFGTELIGNTLRVERVL